MDDPVPRDQDSEKARTPSKPEPAAPENAVLDLAALSAAVKEVLLRLSFLGPQSEREEIRALLERVSGLSIRLEATQSELARHRSELTRRWEEFSAGALPQLQETLAKNGLDDVFRFHALLIDVRDALLGPPRSAADREFARALLTQELSRLQHEVIRLLEKGRRFERRIERIRQRKAPPPPHFNVPPSRLSQAMQEARDALREAVNLLALRSWENNRLSRENAAAMAQAEQIQREIEQSRERAQGLEILLGQAQRRVQKLEAELNASQEAAAKTRLELGLAQERLQHSREENERLRRASSAPPPVPLDSLLQPDVLKLFEAALPPLGDALTRLRQASSRPLPPKDALAAAAALAQVQEMLKSGAAFFSPAPKPALSNPLPIIDSAVRPWSGALRRRNITMIKRYSTGLVPCLLHPERLRMAVHHLLRNAYEAMPRGGTLTLEAAPVPGAIELRFIDNGPGFPKEVLAQPFVPFRPASAGRAGLGLALVKQLVLGFGGSIRLSNGPSGGARVAIQLGHSGTVPTLP